MDGSERTAHRWLAPLLAGLVAGVAVSGVAVGGYNVTGNCTVTATRFVVDGADRTPSGGVLPDGNPSGLICSGRAYVPIRWLGEALGKQVGCASPPAPAGGRDRVPESAGRAAAATCGRHGHSRPRPQTSPDAIAPPQQEEFRC